MADIVFNVALGRVAEKAADGATLKLLVLQAAGSDATLKDLDTVSAVLANRAASSFGVGLISVILTLLRDHMGEPVRSQAKSPDTLSRLP